MEYPLWVFNSSCRIREFSCYKLLDVFYVVILKIISRIFYADLVKYAHNFVQYRYILDIVTDSRRIKE